VANQGRVFNTRPCMETCIKYQKIQTQTYINSNS
jgi:hypothetical protein